MFVYNTHILIHAYTHIFPTTDPLCIYYSLQFCAFMKFLSVRRNESLNLYLFLAPFLAYISFWMLVLSYSDVLDLFFLIIFYFIMIPKKPLCFLTRQRWSRSRWEEPGGTKEGETITRMDCMIKKKFYLQKGKKKVEKKNSNFASFFHMKEIIHIYIYLHMCMCICVCESGGETTVTKKTVWQGKIMEIEHE